MRGTTSGTPNPSRSHVRRSTVFSRWGFVILTALISCQHPIELTTSHADVADLIVRLDGDTTVLARTIRNDRWEGSIPLLVGEEKKLRITTIDFKGLEFSLDDRPDMEIRMDAENGAMVQWEPWQGYGFLRGFSEGTTRIRFLVWHGSHADFITPWLTLVIESANR